MATPEKETKEVKPEPENKPGLPILLIAVVIILIAIGAGIYMYISGGTPTDVKTVETKSNDEAKAVTLTKEAVDSAVKTMTFKKEVAEKLEEKLKGKNIGLFLMNDEKEVISSQVVEFKNGKLNKVSEDVASKVDCNVFYNYMLVLDAQTNPNAMIDGIKNQSVKIEPVGCMALALEIAPLLQLG